MKFTFQLLEKPDNQNELISEKLRKREGLSKLGFLETPFELNLPDQIISRPRFFSAQAFHNEPAWTKFFRIPEDQKLLTAGAGALILFELADYWVAACFGYTKSFLNNDLVVPNFGIQAASSTISGEDIGEITTVKPDTITLRKTQTLSNTGSSLNIEIDPLREYPASLQGVANQPDERFWIDGRSNFALSGSFEFGQIAEKAVYAYRAYLSSDIPVGFDFFNNIKRVADKQTLDALWEHTFKDIMDAGLKKFESPLHISLPEDNASQELVSYRFYNFPRNNTKLPKFEGSQIQRANFVDIDDYYKTLNILDTNFTVDDVRNNHRIEIQYSDKAPERYKLARLLSGNYVLEGINYILMNGAWYIFSNEIVQIVESLLKKIEVVCITPETTRYNETEMNDHLLKMSQDDYSFTVFDKRKINLPTRGYSRANIECCDYIDENCHFVHIKFSDSSGKLSHLWKQGEVCASLISGSDEFRKNFIDRLHTVNIDLHDQLWDIHKMDFLINPSVVFTIVSTKFQSCDDLFLFAKIALYTTIKAIEQNGFKVKLEFLPKHTELPI